jgi:uncharacterized membrane protein
MTTTAGKRISPERSEVSLMARIGIPILAVAGLGIASYLTYVHYMVIEPICAFNMECDEVLSSSYATIWGVPLGLFGALMYAILAIFGLLLWRKDSAWEHLVALGTYGVALAGIVFTFYLYYLEIFILHAFCFWCVMSSIVLLCIFALSVINFFTIGGNLKKSPHVQRFKLSQYIGW